MASATSTPPRSAAGEPQSQPPTVHRPDALQLPVPPSPGPVPRSAAAAGEGVNRNLFPEPGPPQSVPKWEKYMGAPVQTAFIGQMSVFSGLEGDIDVEPISADDPALLAAMASPVKPYEPRTNDDSIYGVPPAAAPGGPAGQGGQGRRARTGRRRLLSGPRRTARRRAFSRSRRYTSPQLV